MSPYGYGKQVKGDSPSRVDIDPARSDDDVRHSVVDTAGLVGVFPWDVNVNEAKVERWSATWSNEGVSSALLPRARTDRSSSERGHAAAPVPAELDRCRTAF